MPKMTSPTGSTIVGSGEVVFGVAGIDELSFWKKDGELQFEYDSNGTNVDWDSQSTRLTTNGERLFVDDDGAMWPESKLKFEFSEGK